jgi:hypothetical protein
MQERGPAFEDPHMISIVGFIRKALRFPFPFQRDLVFRHPSPHKELHPPPINHRKPACIKISFAKLRKPPSDFHHAATHVL